MTRPLIPSVIGSGGLSITPLADSDLHVGTMDRDRRCQSVHLRLHSMSRFQGWISGINPHNFFMGMYKGNTIWQRADAALIAETKQVETICFNGDDSRETYLTVLKTEDDLVGVQTFHETWKDVRDNVPAVWLGRGAPFTDFYATCDELYRAWSKRDKPITKTKTTLGAIDKPEPFVYH